MGYSDVNSRWPLANDPTASSEAAWQYRQKYNFSQEEMGKYDVPAFIDKILDVTGKEKVTYTGYSNGNIQMTFALAAMEESYFAAKVDKAIYQAACYYADPNEGGGWPGYLALVPELKACGTGTPDYNDPICGMVAGWVGYNY